MRNPQSPILIINQAPKLYTLIMALIVALIDPLKGTPILTIKAPTDRGRPG